MFIIYLFEALIKIDSNNARITVRCYRLQNIDCYSVVGSEKTFLSKCFAKNQIKNYSKCIMHLQLFNYYKHKQIPKCNYKLIASGLGCEFPQLLSA